MTLTEQIAWDDTILPFQLDRSGIRGRVARLSRSLDQMLLHHDYPGPVNRLVAEAAVLTALVGHAIKLRWKLSIQIRGEGPVKLIATDYFAPAEKGEPARIRACADYDAEALAAAGGIDTPYRLIGKGLFAILIDQGPGNLPYQGVTPISGHSLAECAATYFAQSEQLPTRFRLAVSCTGEDGKARWRAGGVMLQKLPEGETRHEGGTGADGLVHPDGILKGDEAEDWNRANILLDTVEQDELLGPDVSPISLLVRLFHEEEPRVFDPQPVTFGCTCSQDKVREVLSRHDRAELEEMAAAGGGEITADCRFCGRRYRFRAEDIAAADEALDAARPTKGDAGRAETTRKDGGTVPAGGRDGLGSGAEDDGHLPDASEGGGDGS